MRDFLQILQTHHYFKDSAWNRSDFRYTFETGSVIEFFSADQPSKVRGPRRDRLFLNEANNVAYEAFDQLEVRTKEFVILDWNPVAEFWFYTELQGKRDDIDHLILTYKDNEALDENIVRSIEQRKGNARWWKVYGEGLLGEADGRIYKDWQIIEKVPFEAELWRYGLDFGYSCLKGDTLVRTSTGDKRIDAIVPGDFVLTRSGYQRVSWSGSRGTKAVYEVDFGYGRPIIGTGDHLVFTCSGWKRIDELNEEEIICVKKWSLMEGFTEGIQMAKEKTISFLRKKKERFLKAGLCTETCTQSITGRSQKALSCTILTGTLSTIIHRTLKRFPILSTLKSTITNSKRGLPRSQKNGCKRSMPSLDLEKKTGASDVKRGWKQHLSGLRSVWNAKNAYRTLRTFIKSFAVLRVENETTPATQRENTLAKTAQKFLLALRTIRETHVQKRVRISCRPLNEPVEVFDLTIEGAPEYFANGVLVHNCDPTAIVAVYKYNGGYIVDEVAYRIGMSNREIAETLKALPPALVIADSSEPKSIDEIKLYGVNIIGATKGPGSITQGIQHVQAQKLSVTQRSVNIIKEYRNYLWLTDKDGKTLNEPTDILNHCFAPSTTVITSSGPKRIDELVGCSGYVLTKGGLFKRFSDVKKTRLNAETVLVEFENGDALEVTPDHLLMLPDGSWIEAGLLQSGDLIQSGMYDPNHLQYKAGFLRRHFYKMAKRALLQGVCKWKAAIFAPVCLGKNAWSNTGRLSRSPQRPQHEQQLNSQLRAEKQEGPSEWAYDGGPTRACSKVGGSNTPVGLQVALIRSGEGVAQVAWEENMAKQKTIRENLRSLPFEIYNFAISLFSQVLQSELQNESQTKKVKRVSRGFCPITYNLEVEDTHCLSACGVIAHNSMDALRYGMQNLGVPKPSTPKMFYPSVQRRQSVIQ